MIWDNPAWFLALLLIPLILWVQYRYYRRRQVAYITFSDTSDLDALPGNWREYGVFAGFFLQLIAVSLIILALARPQNEQVYTERTVEGIDIMLVIDVSSSMLAEDMQPNRLLAVKEVASQFIEQRRSDRIGLVIFARESFTLVPPTLDHDLLQNQFEHIDLGMVRDGTAIGMGLATAVNRLRNSDAESRVIILLTDGENNAGEIDPLTAGELAATFGLRLYTIGASTNARTAPYPVHDPIRGTRYHEIRVEIDEEMMQTIAERTGGRYFRATDNESLMEIYREIDELERSEFEEITYQEYTERYQGFLSWGVILLLLSIACDRWLFRTELA
ncbi:MAG: VWA domain-containing protein [Balneolales bacterium]